jgi:tetratricopeptide (TPR) repeat protein
VKVCGALLSLLLLTAVGSGAAALARTSQGIIITGTVTLPDGNPAARVKVRISGQTGLSYETFTDGNGRYQFQVPAGRYRLAATNPQDESQFTDPAEADTGRIAANRVLVHLYLRVSQPAPKRDSKPGTVSLAEASQQIPKNARKAFDEGRRRRADRQLDKALESFTRAIDSYPDYFQALAERGELYIVKSQIPEAVQDFQQALKLNEEYAPTLRGLGYCNLEQQKFSEAVQYLQRAIAVDPSVADTHLFFGIASLALNNRDAAKQALQEALKIDSKSAVSAHVYLADIYTREERYKEAANELRIYLNARPDAPNAQRLKAKEAELRARIK